MNTRKTLLMGNLALLSLLALVIVKMVWLPLNLKQTLEPDSLLAQENPKKVIEPKRPDTANYQSLTNSNLFGSLPDSPSATVESAPTQRLDHLQLLGTVTGPETIARAIIKNKTTESNQIYKIHDWIDDAQLITVRRNEVILESDNQLFKLERTRNPSPSSTSSKTNTTATKTSAAVTQPPQIRRSSFSNEIEVVLKAATTTLTTQSNQEQTGGVALNRIDRFYSAQAAGFKEGDIIQSINGHQIISRKQMFQVLKKAKTQSLIDIEIFRNGQTILLSFEQD